MTARMGSWESTGTSERAGRVAVSYRERPRPLVPRRSEPREQLGLLRVELLGRDHALVPQLAETLERRCDLRRGVDPVRRRRRRGGGSRRWTGRRGGYSVRIGGRRGGGTRGRGDDGLGPQRRHRRP